MLEDVFIVQSAVSAFNNAALYAPAFLWWGVLALPLFVLVYWCSDVIVARMGWNNPSKLLGRISLWTVGLSFAWVIMFSGNYSVLRDGLSALPLVMAGIVFLMSLFLGSYMREFNVQRNKTYYGLMALVVLGVGLSDMHNWWGPVLQIGALVLGWLLGRAAKNKMRPMAGTVLILSMVVIAILMQPEFFRFGQLGNLTVFHLLALLVFGAAAVATMVLNNVVARGRIHQGAYVKLKWLARCLSVLGCALFLLTEALPIFIGEMAMLALMFAMSVWHSKGLAAGLVNKMYAVVLMSFGLITVMPVITALGIVYWVQNPCEAWRRDIKVLL